MLSTTTTSNDISRRKEWQLLQEYGIQPPKPRKRTLPVPVLYVRDVCKQPEEYGLEDLREIAKVVRLPSYKTMSKQDLCFILRQM